ncbi:hypothetical protein GGR54DRAFT_522932 [Hypoxylon sp. NC1633]|nr:hypothetical protein GGR54DRAFT_522932 [Hypoxylon sp. NC1633]
MVKKSSGPNRPSKQPRSSTPASAAATSAAAEKDAPNVIAQSAEETKAQQRLLNIFSDSFREVLDDDDFSAVLQQVKQALYNRDFEAAFGREQFLEVYAARYSPSRALCYSRILGQIAGYLEPLLLAAVDESEVVEDEIEHGRVSPTVDLQDDKQLQKTQPTCPGACTLKVLAIGGGAAEIVAFGNYLRGAGKAAAGDLTLLDVGPWGEVVQKLQVGLTTAPPLSRYASAAAKAASAALVEPAERLTSAFVQQDVLSLDRDGLSRLLGEAPLLVTMLFTLNELYTSGGIGKTTAFLRNLSTTIPNSSILLVVDSSGSYSEAAVGKGAKKYPMQWLLDHTLLQADKLPADGCGWEKLESHDSVWYRLPEGLQYPIDLQDLRYQMHLYRAGPQSSD